MQNYSPELSSPVADSVYVNIYLKNFFAYAENDDVSGVRYPAYIKSARFWSLLEASHVSSHIEELWHKETACMWMTIYIYSLLHLSMKSAECQW